MFKLSVTLSNRIRLSKILHCWKSHEICYKTMTLPFTLGVLLHYPGKSNIQVFYRCGRKRLCLHSVRTRSDYVCGAKTI